MCIILYNRKINPHSFAHIPNETKVSKAVLSTAVLFRFSVGLVPLCIRSRKNQVKVIFHFLDCCL